MIRKSYLSYLLVCIVLLMALSLPKKGIEIIRGKTLATVYPFLQLLAAAVPRVDFSKEKKQTNEMQLLQQKNLLLKNENERLKKVLRQAQTLDRALKILGNEDLKPALERHQNVFLANITSQLEAIPAEVIFRRPSSWGSSFWINIGQDNNHQLNRTIIAKNSPVLIGNAIIGVVDYVGTKQSLVRLITDACLSPSVRVVRGEMDKLYLIEAASSLFDRVSLSDALFENADEKKECLNYLNKAKKMLWKSKKNSPVLLAKGELHGSSSPMWRGKINTLQGIGFNYDYSDEEGEARDLYSGIIKKNDLLVTSGLDGVFPPGFLVAQVTEVKTLKEGDFFYEIEAKPLAGDLNEISTVFVLPPIGFDITEDLSWLK